MFVFPSAHTHPSPGSMEGYERAASNLQPPQLPPLSATLCLHILWRDTQKHNYWPVIYFFFLNHNHIPAAHVWMHLHINWSNLMTAKILKDFSAEAGNENILRHVLNKKPVRRNVVLKADLLLSCLFIVPRLTAVRAASGASVFGISAREAKHLWLNRDSAGSSEKETNDPERDLRARACAQRQAVADSRLMEIVHVIIICGHAGAVRQESFRGKERSALIVGHSLFSVTHGWCGGHEKNEIVQHPCTGCYWLPLVTITVYF